MDPKIQIVAPWRMPEFYQKFQGRTDLLEYAAAKGIPTSSTKAKPFSMDDNIAHCSYEAGILEDPAITPPDDMWTRTIDPRAASDRPVDITITFQQGIPIRLTVDEAGTADKQEFTDSIELFNALNSIGNLSGIGRIDIVEVCYLSAQSSSDTLRTLIIFGKESLHWPQEPWMLRRPCHDYPSTRAFGCGRLGFGC
jgi:argininosuccinate synthase